MTNIIIYGVLGKMGKALLEAANENGEIKVVGGVDKFADDLNKTAFPFPVYKSLKEFDSKIKAEVVIDFSRPDALDDILEFCLKNNCGAVLATTGYSEIQNEQILSASKNIAVFQSYNMSLGVNLLSNLINQAAKFLGDDFDVEIIEKHHNQKVDAPSGTALLLADSVSKAYSCGKTHIYDRHSKTGKREKNEIGISSVRGGNIVGEHEVMFIGKDETITFTHRATSKEIFITGALRAAVYIKDKKRGKYNMNSLTGN